jgi:adenine-specific DNA-methyltransferase
MYWRYSKEKFEELDKDRRIWWGETGNNVPRIKRFLTEVRQGVVPDTIWMHVDVGHTQEAKKELLNACEFEDSQSVFISPKPTRLLQRIFNIAASKDSLILDSFAGSGSTTEAVLKMNKEDGGNRRFILIEMEPAIARDVTAERVRRVAQGYTNSKGEQVAGLGGGFRFCELGEPLFDESGKIRDTVSFTDLARHVYFSETGEPLPGNEVVKSPFLGVCRGVGIYLLYNGILGDKSAKGGNVLTRAVLAQLPPFEGQKVIYCSGCLLSKECLQKEQIIIRQTPYEVKSA